MGGESCLADDGSVLLMVYGLLLLGLFLLFVFVVVWFIVRCCQCAFAALRLSYSDTDGVREAHEVDGKRVYLLLLLFFSSVS